MDLFAILIVLMPIAAGAILLVLGAALLFAAGMAIFTVGPWVLAWLLGRKLRRVTEQRDARGERVAKTFLARIGYTNLPAPEAFVAQLGADAAPEVTLNRITMRPTTGMIALLVVLCGLALGFVLIDAAAFFEGVPYLRPAITAMIGFSLIRTLNYQVDYDTHGFVTRDAMFRRQEVAWRDIADIRDNGQYFYIVRLASGRRVEVFKYLTGMATFLTYARDQMAYHGAAGRPQT